MIRTLLSKFVPVAALLAWGTAAAHAVEILPGQSSIIISEINPNTLWNNEEFIELKGTPGTVLDGLLVTLIDGSTKRVYYTINLQGYTIPASGFFVIGNRAVANVNLVIQDDLTYTGETDPGKLAAEFLNKPVFNPPGSSPETIPPGWNTAVPALPWPNGYLLPWPRMGENLQQVFPTVANYPTGWGYGFLQGGQGNTPDAVAIFFGKKDIDFQSSPVLYRDIDSNDGDFIQDAIIYGRQADAFLSNILLSPPPSPAPVPTDDVSNFKSIGRSVAASTPRNITGTNALTALTPTPGLPNTVPAQTLTLQRLSPANATLSETAGTASFSITRSGSTAAPLVVNLANFDTSELEITSPAAPTTGLIQVTIPAGANTLTVNLKGVNDSWKDGQQIVYITPVAPGFSSRTANTAFNQSLAIFEPFAGSLGFKVEDDPTDSIPYFINEVHGVASNGFGKTNTVGSTDEFNEFIEIVHPAPPANGTPATTTPVDFANYTLTVNGVLKHIFPAGTYLYPDSALVVFSGGSPDKQGRKTGVLGNSLIQNATAGNLSIADTGSIISLRNAGGTEVAGWVFDPVQGGSNLRDNLSDPAILPAFGKRHQLGHSLNVTGAFRTPAAPFTSIAAYTSAGVKQDITASWGYSPGRIELAFTHKDSADSPGINSKKNVAEIAGPWNANTSRSTLLLKLLPPPSVNTVIHVSTASHADAVPSADALTAPVPAPLPPYTAEHTVAFTYPANQETHGIPLSVFANAALTDTDVRISVIASGYESGPVSPAVDTLTVVNQGDLLVEILFADGSGNLVPRTSLVETMGLNAARLRVTKGPGAPAQEVKANVYIRNASPLSKQQAYTDLTVRESRYITLPPGVGTSVELTLDTLAAGPALEVLAVIDHFLPFAAAGPHPLSESGFATTQVLPATAANTLTFTKARPGQAADATSLSLTIPYSQLAGGLAPNVPLTPPLSLAAPPLLQTPLRAKNAAVVNITRPAAGTALNVVVQVRKKTDGFASTGVLEVRAAADSAITGTGIPGLTISFAVADLTKSVVLDPLIELDPLSTLDDIELYVIAKPGDNPLHGHEMISIGRTDPLLVSVSRSTVNENMLLNAATVTVQRQNTSGAANIFLQTRNRATGASLNGPVNLRSSPGSLPLYNGITGLPLAFADGQGSITATLDALVDGDALNNDFTLYAISSDRTGILNGTVDVAAQESIPANSFTLELLNGTKDAVESAGNLAVGLKVTRPTGSPGAIPFTIEVQNPLTGTPDLTEIFPSSGLATGVIADGDSSTTVYFNAINDLIPDGLQPLNLLALSDPWPGSGGFSAPISMAMHDAGVIPLGPFINEFNPDDDTHEFIELFAPGAPNTPLAGLKLAIYDSTGALTLPIISLDGKTTDANGYFTIADPGVYLGAPASASLETTPISLPGGPAAIALYRSAAPPGSALTDGMSLILDSVVYGSTGNTTAPALVSALTFAPGATPTDTGMINSILSSRRTGASSAAAIRTFGHTPGVPTAGYNNAASGFVSWLGSFGLSDGTDGDSDGDGFKNIEEYAYGFNPTIANPPLSDPAALPTFTVPIGELAALDPRIRVTIQTSNGMAAWIDALSRSASDPPPLAPLPLTYTPPPPAPVPLFFRSKVETLPTPP